MVDRVRRRLDVSGQPAGEDHLIGMVLALLSEVAVLRDRLDTVERLAEAGGVLARGDLERYQPNEAVRAERDRQRSRLIAKVMRPLHDALDDAAGDTR